MVESATYEDDKPNFTDDAYLQLELQQSTIFLRNNPGFEDRFAAALSYVSEMKRLCDYRNVAPTVILIPDEMQVSRPLGYRSVRASCGILRLRVTQ